MACSRSGNGCCRRVRVQARTSVWPLYGKSRSYPPTKYRNGAGSSFASQGVIEYFLLRVKVLHPEFRLQSCSNLCLCGILDRDVWCLEPWHPGRPRAGSGNWYEGTPLRSAATTLESVWRSACVLERRVWGRRMF